MAALLKFLKRQWLLIYSLSVITTIQYSTKWFVWSVPYNAKKSFYRSFNANFGKIGRIASADVVMHLIKSKCIPILLYAVEACPVNRSLEKSLQFPVTRILMKIFKTRSSDIVTECENYFGFYSTATLIRKRKATFLHKLVNSHNELCELFSLVAQAEIDMISFT